MKKIRLLAIASLFALSVVSASASTICENFTNNPAADGWQIFGNTNLFRWKATNQHLAVTWDSSQSNSYFYHPLGMTLGRTNNFMLGFEFRLNDIAIGTDPGYPSVFQIGIGLLNFTEATNNNFIIGSGYQAPDVVEFDYFPAFADTHHHYSASVTTPIISSDNNFASVGFTVPLELVPGANYHAVMIYTAADQTLRTALSSNGVPVGPIQDTTLNAGFDDFKVDTISINSYSDAGQDTTVYTNIDGSTVVYAGSVLAHGVVDKIAFGSPLPHTQVLAAAPGQVQFNGATNWVYTLERTADFQSWTEVSASASSWDGVMTLSDTNQPSSRAFYRIRTDLP